MAAQIRRLEKGKTPSLINAQKGNEIIDNLNALQAMIVSPQGMGKLTANGNNAVLDLTPIRRMLDQLAQQLQTLMETPLADNQVTEILNQINNINERLNNASIDVEAVCNGDGTVTVNAELHL